MFLHAGKNRNIPLKRIVGIFDFDTATVESETRKFIRQSDKNGRTEYIGQGFPRSFILCDDGSVCVSSISPTALRGRIPKQKKLYQK